MGTTGGNTADMIESLELTASGRIDPAVLALVLAFACAFTGDGTVSLPPHQEYVIGAPGLVGALYEAGISQLKKLGTSCDWDRERFTCRARRCPSVWRKRTSWAMPCRCR